MSYQELTKNKSLSEVHSSVDVNHSSGFWKRLFYFTGPAFMVAVGYMDPGNWATDLAGGAQFGYKLIWVILLANLIAILFQSLSARLGIVFGRDLAQACRDHYPKPINYILWIICELAVAACDLAEVIGSAIGLYLLFGIPMLWGTIITAFDVILLMFLLSFGIRKMEAFILALIATIGVCFAFEMIISKPDFIAIGSGFIPSMLNGNELYVALGIIGATVMPHNLYLHSALVQSRNVKRTQKGLKDANKFNLIDSIVALNSAFFVNAAILILAAAVFFNTGHSEVASLIDAHALLAPLLGNKFASIAFGVALLAAGQSSTITGTFAGQIVMEGFVGIKIRPWLRRIITRLLAIIPTVIVIKISGDSSVDSLLVLSQVILSLQLPFAIIPLLHFTSSKNKMNEFASRYLVKILAWIAAGFIIIMNLELVYNFSIHNFSDSGITGTIFKFVVTPVIVFLVLLLFWIIIEPYFKKAELEKIEELFIKKPLAYARKIPAAIIKRESVMKIGIALEGRSARDEQIMKGVRPFLKNLSGEIYLIHCVESVTGRFIGDLVADEQAKKMNEYINDFAHKHNIDDFITHAIICGGNPEKEIAKVCKKENIELIVVGSHGHKMVKDIIYGATVDELRHRVRIPVLAIPVEV